MSLELGTSLGSYEILALLGVGGMGEVYRARDTKLGREVAVKVLPEAFAKDAERLARFEREARLLASLNHPNIATIHGLEQSGDVHFLVMELVPGETLAERIKQSAIPVEEALPLFMQIAEALDAAHEKGVVHRDLKPANIKLTPDEKVKVLDFGLAKATFGTPSGDLSESPTITKAATATGVILGTAGYMSPEQARGKTVDKRTDIWAFGCCLYEALTGQITFQGDTLSDTIASILTQDPDWQTLPQTTPASVRRLIGRCLNRDPQRRYRDAWDVRVELEEALTEPSETLIEAVAKPPTSRWQQATPWIAAGLLAATVAFAVWGLLRVAPSSTKPVTKLRLATPSLAEVSSPTVSPNGQRLAFIAEENGISKLFLRPLDQLEARAVEGTAGVQWSPFFSPDSQWIGFQANGKLRKVPVAGGAPVTLCNAPDLRGASWGPDGRIYFHDGAAGPGIMSVSAVGGTPQVVATPEKGTYFVLEVLPGGEAVLVTEAPVGPFADASELAVGVVALETGEYRTLINGTSVARYASTGHLVFGRGGMLLAAPFDTGRLQVSGPEVPVLEGVSGPFQQFAISTTGTLVYLPGTGATDRTLVWVNRKGEVRRILDEWHPLNDARLSPDGQRIAFTIFREGKPDVWLYDIPRGTLSRLTLTGMDDVPTWSPDGSRLIFASNRDGPVNLYSKAADGSSPAERATEANETHWPQAWSPNGQAFVYATSNDLWILPLDGNREPKPFLNTPFREGAAIFSPDGRWLAYNSDESGRSEVYVRAYPGPGARVQVSTSGGREPLWARDGSELFYRSDTGVMRTPVQVAPEFSVGRPEPLFEDRFVRKGFPGRNYDITPDGEEFLMVESPQSAAHTELIVVLNWLEELKRLVPTK